MAGSGVAAQEPNPQPLWNAYPLDDDQGSSTSATQNASTTTTPAQPAASPSSTTRAPVTVTDEAGDGPPWLLMIAAAAGGAMFVVLLLMLQGRRRRDEGPLVGPADEWPWLTSKANGEAREFRVERLRNAPGMPTTNGMASEPATSERERAGATPSAPAPTGTPRERAAEPVANGTAAEPAREPEREVEPERAGEPVANGAAAEPGGAPEPERAAEPVANGAAAEPGGVPEQDVEPERAVEPVANGAAEEPAPPEREPVAEGAAATNGAVSEPASPLSGPDFDVDDADAVPRHRFDRESEAPNGRAAAARRGPICQVRWSAPGTCFYAVTTDVDGVEHRLAWSPPIEWRQPGPPDEDSREARAAVRVLAKDLRDKGWRPMRAKGDDFDEQRWYARRFRFPVVEGDDDVAPWLSSRRPSGSARA
jgi:hypothetical protein